MAKKKKKQSILQTEISFFPVQTHEVVTMTKNFAVMLKAGIPVADAVGILVEQTDGRLKKIVSRVHQRVDSGESLCDALDKEPNAFSSIYVSSVRVGETSGTLAENLLHLSDQMEREYQVKRNVRSAMLYPGVVLTATFFLGIGITTYVLPQMVRVFESLRADLPWSTRFLIWLSNAFQDFGYILIPVLIIGFFGIITLVRQKFMCPVVHPVTLAIPVLKSFLHDVNRARFCRSVGTLLESGVPIQEALEITGSALSNHVYAKSVRAMYKHIDSGHDFSEIMAEHTKLYPKLIQRMVAVGEQSGGLGEMLMYLADYYESKVDNQSKNLSSILEPILLLLIGVVVAFVAMAILSPIYSITSSLKI